MSNASRNEQGMGPLERGRGRYQRKDYAGALEAFTEAVNESTEFILLNALDHRAAALEKLERLQPALKDSKRMIDLKPELSKGYLRCGKILQLKGENELALKIYERGLSKVKIGTDDQRTMLQKMYRKLRESLGIGKIYDPLEFLPLELAQMICNHLSMRDRVVCLAVTPAWKKVLESMHELWTTLDTSSTRKAVKKQSLKSHVRRSNYTINHAIISMKASLDSSQMQYLTRTCKKLKTLEMCGFGIIGSSLVDALPDAHGLESLTVAHTCEISLGNVRQALRIRNKSLLNASFQQIKGKDFARSFTNFGKLEALKSLELRSVDGCTLDIDGLVKATPNVERVTLMGWHLHAANFDATTWEHLEDLNLMDMNLIRLPILPATLKSLCLNDNYHLGMDRDDVLKLPLLEHLSIRGCLDISSADLFALTAESIKSGLLKSLEVGGRLHDSRIPVTTQYPASESLEALGFDSMIVGDKDIMAVVDLYPKLQKLNINGTKVTGVGLRYIVDAGIKDIKVCQCDELGGDAVVWAKEKSVEVDWRPNVPRLAARGYRDLAFY